MLFCHCSEIPNNIWARGPIFLFFTVSHKLCNWPQIRDSSMLWCVLIIHSPLLLSSKYPILWIHHNLFIYSPDNLFIHSYLDIWVFSVTNKASVNICWQGFTELLLYLCQKPYTYSCISEISILFYSSICLYTSTILSGLSYSYEKSWNHIGLVTCISDSVNDVSNP